jgi:hypothetical protein
MVRTAQNQPRPIFARSPDRSKIRCGESSGGDLRAPKRSGLFGREHRRVADRRQMTAAADLRMVRTAENQPRPIFARSPDRSKIRCGESAGGDLRAPKRSGLFGREHRRAADRRQMATTADLRMVWRRDSPPTKPKVFVNSIGYS